MPRHLTDNRGFALPLVLVVMVVLTLFCGVIISMGTTGALSAANQSNAVQAYYLARSGADAVASYIVGNPDALSSSQMDSKINSIIAGGKSSPFKLSASDPGTIQVQVQKDSSTLSVTSEGTVSGITKTVTRTIYLGVGTVPLAFQDAIFSKGKLDFTGSAITGDIASLDKINLDWGTLTGKIFISPDANPYDALLYRNAAWPYSRAFPVSVNNMSTIPSYPNIPFPTYPAYITTLTTVNSQMVVNNNTSISSNAYYKGGIVVKNNTLTINRDDTDRIIRTTSLAMQGSGKIVDNRTGEGKLIIQVDGTLTIDVGTSITLNIGNQDVVIMAKDVNIPQGFIVVNRPTGGKGKLYIYADTSLIITGSSRVNTTSLTDSTAMGDPSLAYVYYKGTAALTLGGSTQIAATLHVNQAALTLTNGNGITGNIISGGSSLVISGDASAAVKVVYAPNAFVDMSGSGKIKGALVAGSVKMAGGASVTYSAGQTGLDYFTVNTGTTYDYGIWK